MIIVRWAVLVGEARFADARLLVIPRNTEGLVGKVAEVALIRWRLLIMSVPDTANLPVSACRRQSVRRCGARTAVKQRIVNGFTLGLGWGRSRKTRQQQSQHVWYGTM